MNQARTVSLEVCVQVTVPIFDLPLLEKPCAYPRNLPSPVSGDTKCQRGTIPCKCSR